ncbi:MAG: UDP-glucuronic acid decarboxylase family protein [Aquificaceae bacterium]
MRVLITGAAGFIGSHLCDRFLKEGFDVVGIDNFLTGSPNNIQHLLEQKRFKFIHYNVVNYIFLEGPFDMVLHFACPASPVDYLTYPIHTMKVDSLGTMNTLGFARLKRARYIFASTSEVYGNPHVHPQPETYWGYVNPIGPRSVYDEAKRFSEAMCMAYYREHDVDVRVLRIFNTYGPRMRIGDGRVVPNFITQAIKNEPITVYGRGDQTRSFCFIDDLVEGVFRASVKDGIAGEVINLGNPKEIKILDFANMVIELTGSKSQILFKPLPPDDPERRCPDITKAKEVLAWSPRVNLKEGLLCTIEWFRNMF